MKITEDRDEEEIVEILLDKIKILYGEDRLISRFVSFVKKHRKEVFLYPDNPEVEKTSGLVEQHFSIQSLLLKNQFNKEEGLLRAPY